MREVLVVDDDEAILKLVTLSLKDNFNVRALKNGSEALEHLKNHVSDIIILDIGLPDTTGYEICSYLKSRSELRAIPVVILSAKMGATARTTAYQLGASNYLEKPFDPKELLEMVKSIDSRLDGEVSKKLHVGDLKLNVLEQRVLNRENQEISLTTSEFKILCLFSQHMGEVIAREDLSRLIGHQGAEESDRGVDTHISALRRKIKDQGVHIKAIYKEGYILKKAS